jgi:hypothetical protein
MVPIHITDDDPDARFVAEILKANGYNVLADGDCESLWPCQRDSRIEPDERRHVTPIDAPPT